MTAIEIFSRSRFPTPAKIKRVNNDRDRVPIEIPKASETMYVFKIFHVATCVKL